MQYNINIQINCFTPVRAQTVLMAIFKIATIANYLGKYNFLSSRGFINPPKMCLTKAMSEYRI